MFPKTRPRSTDAPSFDVSNAGILAGESPCENVDRRHCPPIELGNVVEDFDSWPVLLKDSSRIGVEFDEPGRFKPLFLEAELNASDATEEGTDTHQSPSPNIGFDVIK